MRAKKYTKSCEEETEDGEDVSNKENISKTKSNLLNYKSFIYLSGTFWENRTLLKFLIDQKSPKNFFLLLKETIYKIMMAMVAMIVPVMMTVEFIAQK